MKDFKPGIMKGPDSPYDLDKVLSLLEERGIVVEDAEDEVLESVILELYPDIPEIYGEGTKGMIDFLINLLLGGPIENDDCYNDDNVFQCPSEKKRK